MFEEITNSSGLVLIVVFWILLIGIFVFGALWADRKT
jgi:hypothetical protein